MATIYVDAAWASKSAGDKVTVNGTEYTIGVDAFADIKSALNKANEIGGATIDLGNESYVYSDSLQNDADMAVIDKAGTYTITGGNGVLVNYELEINPEKVEADYIVNWDEANITMTKLTLRDSVIATISDSVMNFKGFLGNGSSSGPSYLSVYRDSALTINNSTVGLDISRADGKFDNLAQGSNGDGLYNNFGATWTVYGSLSVTNSTIYAGTAWGADSFVIHKGATGSLVNSTANVVHMSVGYAGAEDKKLNEERTNDNASLVLDNTKVYNSMYQGDGGVTPGGLLVGSSDNTNANTVVIKNNSVVDMTINGSIANSPVDKGLYVGNAESSVSIESGSSVIVNKGENAGTINVAGSTLKVNGTLTNDGAINVSGESTLNIGTLTGETVDFMDGAIIKDSTINGGVFVAGNVTFRGDNTFGMISDFGTLTDYYGTTANMAWTVEAGASVTLTDKARYGLGYGDKVAIYGNIAAGGAAAARATLNDEDASNDVKSSLFMHGLVAQESKGWNCDSSFTVENAYVQIGSNNSFGNKPGNYGGTYTFMFDNAVVDSSRITFYEALSKTTFTFKNSDVVCGTFMTRDADSVFTLDNTVLLSTTTTNGNDEGNYQAGTLKIVNGSALTYSAAVTNTGTIEVAGSTLVAPAIVNNGAINVSGASTLNIAALTGNAVKVYDGAEIADSYIGGQVNLVSGEINWSGKNTVTGIFSAGYYNYEMGDLTVNITGEFTNSNFLAWNVDGSQTTVNIGAADAARTTFNGGQIGIFENTVVNINNADVSYNYSFIRSDFNVTGSALTCTSANTYFSAQSKVVVDSSTWYLGSHVTLGGYGVVTAVGSADMTLQNGSTVTAGNVTLAAVTSDAYSVSLTVKDATFTATGILTVGAGTSFNVAADSVVTIGTLAGTGTITVDATNFAGGIVKVVDANSSTFTGEINVENLADGVSVVYGADGDVVLTDVAADAFFVDAAFTGQVGDEVAAGKYVGINAFATVGEAMSAKGSADVDVWVSSDVSEVLSGKTLTGAIKAESAVTVTDSANSDYVNIADANIGENVTIDAKYFYIYGGESTIAGNVTSSSNFYCVMDKLVITGTASVYNTFSRYYSAADEGIYIVGNAEAGKAVEAAVQYHGTGYLGHYSGTFSVQNSAAEFGYLNLVNTHDNPDGTAAFGAKVVLDNGYLKTIGGPNTQPGHLIMKGNVAIELTNKSVLDISGPKGFGYLAMTNGTITVNDSTFIMGKEGQGTNEVGDTLNVVNGTVQALGKIVNKGTINISGASSITATWIDNANGTITIDAAGITEYTKLIDVSGSSALAGTVTVENLDGSMGYMMEADGDVTLVELGVIKVDAALEGTAVGTDLGNGFFFGVNAFASLDDFSRSADASQGVRTIKYTADKSGALEIGITSVSGRTDYQIGGYSRYVRAGNTKTETLKVEAGNEYTFVFTNEQADFELSYKTTAANAAKDFDVAETATGITIEAGGSVAEAIGKQELSFTLDSVGDLNFTISISNEGKVEYTLLDAAGKTVLHGYSSKAIRRWADNLAQGEYTLVVESMDGKTANFEVSGEVDYKVTGPSESTMVSDADDTIASAFEMASGTTAISNWVGNTDGIDYIDITDALKEGRNYLSIQVAGSAQATIWTRTNGELVELISWNISDETDTRALRCTAGVEYFVSMKSDNDSNYTMQLS